MGTPDEEVQLVDNGPCLPAQLVQAQSEGRVVFFCGSGISAGPPMRLPLFKRLTEQCFTSLGVPATDEERKHFERDNFDLVLDKLAARLYNGNARLRHAVAELLTPSSQSCNSYHQDLLKLAKHNGATRLVTTNFDHGFIWAGCEAAYELSDLARFRFDTWDGVVYLHGQLPRNGAAWRPENLVLTSGEFGRAYLHERTATTFLLELMKRYTLCFIGYSARDPIILYLLNGIKLADQTLPLNRAYLIGDERPSADIEWIPYKQGAHHQLAETLTVWAKAHETSWQSIIDDQGCAAAPPRATQSSDASAPQCAAGSRVAPVLQALRHEAAVAAFCAKQPDIRWLTDYARVGAYQGGGVVLNWPSRIANKKEIAAWMVTHAIAKRHDLLYWAACCKAQRARQLPDPTAPGADRMMETLRLYDHFCAALRDQENLPPVWRCFLEDRVAVDPLSSSKPSRKSSIADILCQPANSSAQATLHAALKPRVAVKESTLRLYVEICTEEADVLTVSLKLADKAHPSWLPTLIDLAEETLTLRQTIGVPDTTLDTGFMAQLNEVPIWELCGRVVFYVLSNPDSLQHQQDTLARCWTSDQDWLQRLALAVAAKTKPSHEWLRDDKLLRPAFAKDMCDKYLGSDRALFAHFIQRLESTQDALSPERKQIAFRYAKAIADKLSDSERNEANTALQKHSHLSAHEPTITEYPDAWPPCLDYDALPQQVNKPPDLVSWLDQFSAIKAAFAERDKDILQKLDVPGEVILQVFLSECERSGTTSQRREVAWAHLFEKKCLRDNIDEQLLERTEQTLLADPARNRELVIHWASIMNETRSNFETFLTTAFQVWKPSSRYDTNHTVRTIVERANKLAAEGRFAPLNALRSCPALLNFYAKLDLASTLFVTQPTWCFENFRQMYASTTDELGLKAWEHLLMGPPTVVVGESRGEDREANGNSFPAWSHLMAMTYPQCVILLSERFDELGADQSPMAWARASPPQTTKAQRHLARLLAYVTKPSTCSSEGLPIEIACDKAFSCGSVEVQLRRFLLTLEYWDDEDVAQCVLRYLPQHRDAQTRFTDFDVLAKITKRVENLVQTFTTDARQRLAGLLSY